MTLFPSLQDPPPQSSFPLLGPVTSPLVDRGMLSLEGPFPRSRTSQEELEAWSRNVSVVRGKGSTAAAGWVGGSLSGRGWAAVGPALALAEP